MSLVEYRRKRDFAKTPEPAGSSRGAAQPDAARRHRFVVQSHAAQRLHYDFRLELDGVLKSWAVPKGPSLDPGERRLAVQVEDHPLDYAGFEGVIPAGEYGGGTVMVWDAGTWEPEGDPREGYAKGHLRFRLHGDRLHGMWSLVRTGRRRRDGASGGEAPTNWLLIKRSDEAAEPGSSDAVLRRNPGSVVSGRGMAAITAAPNRRVWTAHGTSASVVNLPALRGATPAPLPDPLPPPQLATAAEAAPGGDDWLYELKWDGYRLIAAVALDGSVRLASRNGLDWSERFPEIAAALAALHVGDAVLDGELVRLRPEDGVPSFSGLKADLSEGRTDRLVYVVFDLLHLDGHDLRDVAVEDRKAALETILSAASAAGGTAARLRFSEHLAGQGASFAAHACALGVEGIVAKRRGSRYGSGTRSKDWLKIKCVRREEFAVVGWTPPVDGGRAGIGSLLLGYHDPAGRLHYAGGVGSGFSRAEHAALRRLLDAMPRGARPPGKDVSRLAPAGARWVEPQAVAEIRFADWTADGLLRHATYLGLREDKDAHDVVIDRRNGDTADAAPRVAAAPAAADPRRARSRLWKGEIEVAGVVISNAGKQLYPDVGITKGDLAHYYASIADHILPHLAGRPLSLVRAPDGIGGQVWFQKHERAGTSDAVRRIRVVDNDGDGEDATQTFLGVDDAHGLVSFVQMGVVEIHPWGSRLPDLERPDRLVFDLDPDETVGWERVVEAALQLRASLAGIGLESFPKTTGGKGLHLVVPLGSVGVGWDGAKAFAKHVAEAFAAAAPQRFTSLLTKRARRGRIFIDYLRNGRGATAVAPYSTRARPGATVATPVSWREVEAGLDPAAFTVATLPSRLAALTSDPWAGFEKATAAAAQILAGR